MAHLNASDILYENGKFWVCHAKHGCRTKQGFEVYETGITHSTRVAVIGYEGDKGLTRAKYEADRRAALAIKF